MLAPFPRLFRHARPGFARLGFRVMVVCALSHAMYAGNAAADIPPEKIGAATIDQLRSAYPEPENALRVLRARLWEVEAELEVLDAERKLTYEPPGLDLAEIDSRSRGLAVHNLSDSLGTQAGELSAARIPSLDTIRDRAVELANSANGEINQAALTTATVEKQYRLRTDSEVPAWTRILFSRELLAPWLIVLFVTVLVGCVILHDQRRAWRRYRRPKENLRYSRRRTNRSTPKVVTAGMLLAMAALGVSGCSFQESQEELASRHSTQAQAAQQKAWQEAERLLQDVREKEARLAADNAELERLYGEALRNKSHASGSPPSAEGVESLPAGAPAAGAIAPPTVAQDGAATDETADGESPVAEWGESEQRSRRAVREGLKTSLVATRAGRDAEAAIKELDSHETQLDRLKRNHGDKIWSLLFIRCVVVVSLVSFNGLAWCGWVWLRRREARSRQTGCPRCLAEGKMKEVVDAEVSQRGKAFRPVKCAECEYEMLRAEQGSLRLSFPTIGFRGSGKTFWMCMFHHKAKSSQASNDLVRIQRANSLHAAQDEKFDRLVDVVFHKHKPRGTQLQSESKLDFPLMFRFEDSDPWGKQGGLIYMFDHAGALMSPEGFELTRVRERALNAEGFILFLDPRTKEAVQALKGKLTVEEESVLPTTWEQINLVQNFCENLRTAVGGKPGDKRIPIAVCITKIDMMYREQDDSMGLFRDFATELQAINAGERSPSLDTVRRRHELFLTYRDSFFPGWPIERLLEDEFGGSFMFFPLSSVGFDDPGQGELEKREYASFGIIEPVLWLLHMQGFKTMG